MAKLPNTTTVIQKKIASLWVKVVQLVEMPFNISYSQTALKYLVMILKYKHSSPLSTHQKKEWYSHNAGRGGRQAGRTMTFSFRNIAGLDWTSFSLHSVFVMPISVLSREHKSPWNSVVNDASVQGKHLQMMPAVYSTITWIVSPLQSANLSTVFFFFYRHGRAKCTLISEVP